MSRRSIRGMRRQLHRKTGLTPELLAYHAAASRLSDEDLLRERDKLMAELRAATPGTEQDKDEHVMAVLSDAHVWGHALTDEELLTELDEARLDVELTHALRIAAATNN